MWHKIQCTIDCWFRSTSDHNRDPSIPEVPQLEFINIASGCETNHDHSASLTDCGHRRGECLDRPNALEGDVDSFSGGQLSHRLKPCFRRYSNCTQARSEIPPPFVGLSDNHRYRP